MSELQFWSVSLIWTLLGFAQTIFLPPAYFTYKLKNDPQFKAHYEAVPQNSRNHQEDLKHTTTFRAMLFIGCANLYLYIVYAFVAILVGLSPYR